MQSLANDLWLPLAQMNFSATTIAWWAVIGLLALIALFVVISFFAFGALWVQAFAASARVSMLSLIGMYFRQVRAPIIVHAKIMAAQAGLDITSRNGILTQRLEAHYLAGGNVMNVIQAIIAAHRAGIDLDFDRAAAIDLAGRDVQDAVRTSVQPKVIDCPDPRRSGKATLSAIARRWCRIARTHTRDGAHQSRTVDRWCYRRDDHRSRWREHHQFDWLERNAPGRTRESRHDLSHRAPSWTRRADGLSDCLDRYRRH